MGRGWWSWIIPLSNGDFSAGVTWDERIFTPPAEGSIGERLKQHLLAHPVGKLMFENGFHGPALFTGLGLLRARDLLRA